MKCWNDPRVWIILSTLAASSTAAEKTFPFDPVELSRGSETAGLETLCVVDGSYRYLLDREETRTEFSRDPARYRIQLGGSCARMGPLGGSCQISIYAVTDGRLYLFASEACRSTFLKNPEVCLDRPDPSPAGDAASNQRGRKCLDRAIEAAGGAERLKAIRVYRERLEGTDVSDGKTYPTGSEWTISFEDGRARHDEWWGTSRWGTLTDGIQGASIGSGGLSPLVEEQRQSFLKDVGHRLPMVLRSAAEQGGVRVDWVGEKVVDGRTLDLVLVGESGISSQLGIDRETGRVLTQSYRGHGPRLTYGKRELHFSDFREINGITLPATTAVSFDDKPLTDVPRTLAAIEFDVALPPDFFQVTD